MLHQDTVPTTNGTSGQLGRQGGRLQLVSEAVRLDGRVRSEVDGPKGVYRKSEISLSISVSRCWLKETQWTSVMVGVFDETERVWKTGLSRTLTPPPGESFEQRMPLATCRGHD